MSSNAARKRKEVMDGDRSEEDSNDDSSENGDQQQQQPHTRDRDNTLPQSSSVTAVTTSTLPSLPSLAEAAAAAAPAPEASRSTKKSRRAGFREQFLQQLRVMLDRESQMNSTIVQWSTDGNSFIVMDQNRFEEQTIPTYFDNRIIFTSFLRKLSRWGFRRVARSSHTRYEFVSPTFRRLGGESAAGTAVAEDDAPVAAHAAAASAAIGGASASDTNPSANIQQQLRVAPPLPQVGTMQANHQTTTAPNDYLPSQQASQAADVIASLLSNIMQRSNQQPSTPSQQSSTVANSILQGNIDWSSIQHPNPTTNQLLGNAVNTFSAQQQQQQQQPPPQQLGASYHSQQQSNPLSALMSLIWMLPNQPAATNTSTTSTSQVAQSLLMLMHQIGEEDMRRRAQVEAIQSTLVSIIAVIISGQRGQMAAEYDRHQRISDLLEMVGRPNNIDALQNQEHASTSTSAHLNVQAPRRDEAEDQGGGSRREFPIDDGDNSQYDADSDNDDDHE